MARSVVGVLMEVSVPVARVLCTRQHLTLLLKVSERTLDGVLVRIPIAMTKHRGQKQAGEERVLWLAPSYP